jgi:Ca-activated chloride channel family protein
VSVARPILLWLLLLAPAAGLAAAWLWRRRAAAEAAWVARGLRARLAPGGGGRRRAAQALLLALAVAGCALALARPRWGVIERPVERRGVDVVFVVDSSLSMAARDVVPSRLFVAKALIRDLVRRMPGNRVALIAAEGRGEVLAPLTLDGAVLDLLLDTLEPGSLPVPGTELASSLDAARALFAPAEEGHRAVVLLTDGEDHGSGLAAAAERLAAEDAVLHAIGIGTPEGAPVPLPTRSDGRSDGRGEGFKRDAAGEPVISRLGAAALERAAAAAGGIYLPATSAAADTRPLVGAIEAMDKTTFEESVLETLAERFQWPLAAAALALAALLAAGSVRPARRGEVA